VISKRRDGEKRMNGTMPCMGAHPVCGEEVMVMDDADVNIRRGSISSISALKERMGEK
jgi:hypothetical protein